MGKYHTVVADLRDRIKAGEFEPKLRLPTETSIAEDHSVSRSVVRRALDDLVSQGLATKKPGCGYFAVPTNSESALPLVCVMNNWGGQMTSQDAWEKPISEGLLAGGSMFGVRLYQDMSAAGVHGSHLPGNVDGLIIILLGQVQVEPLLAKLPQSLPRVLVNRPSPHPQVPSITVDNYTGSYRATRAMLDMGHTRIATDLPSAESRPFKQRLRGFIDAHKDAGVEICDDLQMRISAQSANTPAVLKSCLQRPDRPTSLLLHASTAETWLHPVLQELNLTIPDDISLTTFDEEHGPFSNGDVKITAVVQPLYQMGMEAIRLVRSMLDVQATEYPNVVLEPNLILRDSLRPFKTNS